jgi:hypothetical protein
VLGFKRQPLPGARYVDQDGADSQVWGVLGHLPTLGGVLSALDRRNHSRAPDQNPRYPDTDKMFRPLDIGGMPATLALIVAFAPQSSGFFSPVEPLVLLLDL